MRAARAGIGWGAALLCLLTATAALAQADGTSERRFKLHYHGELIIRVPDAWKSDLRQPKRHHRPPTILFTPAAGNAFKLLLNPIWPIAKLDPPRTSDDDRVFVERAAQRYQSRSVEEDLPILELKGRSGPGYYYRATDRIADPEGFQYVTEGVLQVDRMSLGFTILTNDPDDPVVEQAFDAVKGAVRKGG